MEKRDSFASSFGVLVAMAGSAVGLGNLWRFPYLVGTNGGAAFIIIYLAIIAVLALPIMYSEFVVGRRAQSNVYGAFKKLAPGTKWGITGVLAILCCILIVSFYSVVGGWTIDYLVKAISGEFSAQSTAFDGLFAQTVSSNYRPLVFMLLFVGTLMASRLPTISLKAVHIRKTSLLPVMAGLLLLIAFLATHFWLTIGIIGFLYMLTVPLTAWIFLRVRASYMRARPEQAEVA